MRGPQLCVLYADRRSLRMVLRNSGLRPKQRSEAFASVIERTMWADLVDYVNCCTLLLRKIECLKY
ncbi:hypothetical protein DPMN_098711 [Dreissena polymorpha]|uniref:Uncharacterized protein n=1 Tax=Dreissena polymorpha TaxID=45954 RepID=A0A9D4LDJ8_DREPO|nr:hypothetical protein DPMN_098711 [Dreissena polymorpha]